jgi:6-phosphogluconolactonase (cycloisomerase 2 family)
MSVGADGKLTQRPDRHTVNTHDKTNRVSTMVVVSPNEKFLFVGTTFDEPIVTTGLYPDGSPILWVQRNGGALHSIASNAPDPDGLAVFPIKQDGSLGTARLYDARGGSPFYIAFLHGRPKDFIIGYAVGDGVSIGSIEDDGQLTIGPVVKIDTSNGVPTELCWASVSSDDKFIYATNFGYSNISSYRISGNELAIASDPACPKVPGDGTARALNGTVTSGPADNWLSPDDAFLYQIYGNAAKLVCYATQADGSLKEVGFVKIPYNSPQGLAGF